MKFSSYQNHLLKIIHLIEDSRESFTSPDLWQNKIEEIKNEISLLSHAHQEQKHISKLQGLLPRIHHRLNPTQLLHFAVPFHRELENFTDFGSTTASQKDQKNHVRTFFPLILLLDNLRSAENVGSIIRTAECFGVEKIILTGYTPDLTHPIVKKSSMGTENNVCIETSNDLHRTIQELKNDQYKIIGLEISEIARPLHEFFKKEKSVLIFGNERFGLTQKTIQSCDDIRQIGLYGNKNSLNVSVSVGIALYEWTQQWQK